MKHAVHTDELSIIRSDYQKNLRYVCETVIQDIFSELLRLNKAGVTTTVALHPTHLSIYVHEHEERCTAYGAHQDSPEELIDLLHHLEETTGKEEHTDAEALS